MKASLRLESRTFSLHSVFHNKIFLNLEFAHWDILNSYKANLVKALVKKYRVGWARAERGGSSVLGPLARGETCNFQLPIGGG